MNVDDIEFRIICSGRNRDNHRDRVHVHTLPTLTDAKRALADWTSTAADGNATEQECLPLTLEIREVSRWAEYVAPTADPAPDEIAVTGLVNKNE